jgi:sigma-B regulation protein RsbU (phosphoserine phosphatase)
MTEDYARDSGAAPNTYLAPDRALQEHRDLLASLLLCSGIPFSWLEPFFRKCEFQQLPPKSPLLSPGIPNHYLYVLLSGELVVHMEATDYEKGLQVLPGEFVGEISIIDSLAPTAYVTAVQESLLLCIPETVLWSEFFHIPGAARNLLRQIAERMRSRNLIIQKSLEQALRLEHLEKELRIAQDIQTSILPPQPFFPLHPKADVDAIMKPAKEVGGDFFDAFPLDEDRICVAIGDVAGKGVPAALFMMRSITVLRNEMMKTQDLRQTISAMNIILSSDNPMLMFVTLMICVLDVSSGHLQWVNGGHNPPLYGNPSGGFRYLKQPSGILVGVEPETGFEIAALDMSPGDMLILYTDGVTEANNPSLEDFSTERLLNLLNQDAERNSSSVVAKIHDAVKDFAATAEQSDDLTLLVLRYVGGGTALKSGESKRIS